VVRHEERNSSVCWYLLDMSEGKSRASETWWFVTAMVVKLASQLVDSSEFTFPLYLTELTW